MTVPTRSPGLRTHYSVSGEPEMFCDPIIVISDTVQWWLTCIHSNKYQHLLKDFLKDRFVDISRKYICKSQLGLHLVDSDSQIYCQNVKTSGNTKKWFMKYYLRGKLMLPPHSPSEDLSLGIMCCLRYGNLGKWARAAWLIFWW